MVVINIDIATFSLYLLPNNYTTMKTISASITLFFAVLISAVAAYFSVVGLAALFAATFIPVVIMGSSLEAAKIVAAQWLHENWSNPNVNVLHKSYMTAAVGALMLITAIGIYGFLSKGHLEQEAPLAGIELQVKQRELQIESIVSNNTALQTKLTQLDKSVDLLMGGDKVNQGLKARNSQKYERTQIANEIKANNEKIAKFNEEILPLKMQTNEVEAKLGPIKYVAELFGWTDANSAVRFVILLLMFAFDPLAIAMLLSAMISFRELADEKKTQKLVSNIVDLTEVANSYKEQTITTPVELTDDQKLVVDATIKAAEVSLEEKPQTILNIIHSDEHDSEYDAVAAPTAVTPISKLKDENLTVVDQKKVKYKKSLQKFVKEAYQTNVDDAVTTPTIDMSIYQNKFDLANQVTDQKQLIDLLEKQPELLEVMIDIISGYKKPLEEPKDQMVNVEESTDSMNEPENQNTNTASEAPSTTRNSWLPHSNI